ncbi:hypothetical protein [Actinoallomurus sp. CA-142502]|uniref:hypothetical protein n=1 Tax=Actinoallomurus sp. CA-142502 TaxID=3239885 RepID=UPI003D90AC21
MAKKNEASCCEAAAEADEADAPERTLTLTGEEADAWDEFVGVKTALRMINTVVDNGSKTTDPDRWSEEWEKLSAEQKTEAAYFLTTVGGCATSKVSGTPREWLLLASTHWLMPEEVRRVSTSSDNVTALQATGTE